MPRLFERRRRPWPKQSTQKTVIGERRFGSRARPNPISVCADIHDNDLNSLTVLLADEDVLIDSSTIDAARELADINPEREEEDIASSYYLPDLAVGEAYGRMKVATHTKIPLDHQMEDVDS
jgi:hypothetical protein